MQGLRKQIGQQQRSHGRIEQRSCYVIDVPEGRQGAFAGPSLRGSIGLLYRHSTSTDKQGETKESHDVAFFIISLDTPRSNNEPNHIEITGRSKQRALRSGCRLTEDASRIRTGSAPEVAAAFRRLSLNILQQDRSLKENIRGKRLRAGWDAEAASTASTPHFCRLKFTLTAVHSWPHELSGEEWISGQQRCPYDHVILQWRRDRDVTGKHSLTVSQP
ncbi:MAG: hypothetical protein R3B91_01170 [Planctomycetaceae bacterium]